MSGIDRPPGGAKLVVVSLKLADRVLDGGRSGPLRSLAGFSASAFLAGLGPTGCATAGSSGAGGKGVDGSVAAFVADVFMVAQSVVAVS